METQKLVKEYVEKAISLLGVKPSPATANLNFGLKVGEARGYLIVARDLLNLEPMVLPGNKVTMTPDELREYNDPPAATNPLLDWIHGAFGPMIWNAVANQTDDEDSPTTVLRTLRRVLRGFPPFESSDPPVVPTDEVDLLIGWVRQNIGTKEGDELDRRATAASQGDEVSPFWALVSLVDIMWPSGEPIVAEDMAAGKRYVRRKKEEPEDGWVEETDMLEPDSYPLFLRIVEEAYGSATRVQFTNYLLDNVEDDHDPITGADMLKAFMDFGGAPVGPRHSQVQA